MNTTRVTPSDHGQETIESTCTGPRIVLFGTGGTIASSGASATQLHDYRVTATLEEVMASVPHMHALGSLTGEQVFNVPSHDIDNGMLLQLAQRVAQALNDPDVDGIVLTHGTDTLEETAYFLDLVTNSEKPVVVVGAMRPAQALSADGPLNLYNAVKVAASPQARGKGVLVVLDDRIVAARYASKRHTSATDAFRPHEHGLLGEITGGIVRFFYSLVPRHVEGMAFALDKMAMLPQVDVIFDHIGAGEHLYDASIASGAKGIVLAATGNGSLSVSARAGARKAQHNGVLMVRSTRTGSGTVLPLADDADFHTICANGLNPQKARLLLMLVLTKTADFQIAQRYFDCW
ncbi:asparaginase [Paraburkholderia sp. A3BS-1L]|uniref:asparaginase n=1 Tax=Paraburkholderia sp. A3BS-1L TaxID=3028375 RepID=UPI003DAA4DC0